MLNGIIGVIVLFVVVMFVFGGIEIIGVIVSEVKDLEKVLLCVINIVFVCILLFYVLILFVLMVIYLWNSIG